MSWDQLFDKEAYHYGTEPARFLQRQSWRLPRGAQILSLGEGEGRNAVWLASQGHRLSAIKSSPTARAKARALAVQRGVTLELIEDDLRGWDWPEPRFDAVLACFIQFADPALRADIFDGIAHTLKPGGLVLLHGFARRQPRYGTGGPQLVEQLYDLDLLRAAFPRWQILHQADYDSDLHEGEGHKGRAALIDFIARKPGAA